VVRRRLIPVVLLRDGVAVQSRGFRRWQVLGNPVTIVERLAAWSSDELIYLDIGRGGYDLGRDDLNAANRTDVLGILEDVAARCFMPLTFGGRIRSVADAGARLERGADKIAVTSGPLADPALLTRLADEFGHQCVVVGIDAVRGDDGDGWRAMAGGGRAPGREDAVAWAREAVERGAGEILLQSVDRDGRGGGYDLDLVAAVRDAVRVPVIALGGVGGWPHLLEGLAAGADAVAAANIFNHSEHAVHKAKAFLQTAGAPVRPGALAADDALDPALDLAVDSALDLARDPTVARALTEPCS